MVNLLRTILSLLWRLPVEMLLEPRQTFWQFPERHGRTTTPTKATPEKELTEPGDS